MISSVISVNYVGGCVSGEMAEEAVDLMGNCEDTGVDLGAQTTAATSRGVVRPKSRTDVATRRRSRLAMLSAVNRKANRLAVTSTAPIQSYDSTTLGMPPSQMQRQRVSVAVSIAGMTACHGLP